MVLWQGLGLTVESVGQDLHLQVRKKLFFVDIDDATSLFSIHLDVFLFLR